VNLPTCSTHWVAACTTTNLTRKQNYVVYTGLPGQLPISCIQDIHCRGNGAWSCAPWCVQASAGCGAGHREHLVLSNPVASCPPASPCANSSCIACAPHISSRVNSTADGITRSPLAPLQHLAAGLPLCAHTSATRANSSNRAAGVSGQVRQQYSLAATQQYVRHKRASLMGTPITRLQSMIFVFECMRCALNPCSPAALAATTMHTPMNIAPITNNCRAILPLYTIVAGNDSVRVLRWVALLFVLVCALCTSAGSREMCRPEPACHVS
jgi:hypothetical protein